MPQLVRDSAHLPHGILDHAILFDTGGESDGNAEVYPTARTVHSRAVEPRLNSPWNKVVGGLTPVEGVRI